MASNNDSRVYKYVIDDVIRKVRDEFINYGAGEAVLSEIRSLWEMKMMQMQIGATSGNTEGSSSSSSAAPRLVNPVHDLNVPYEGPTDEENGMLFPPTPLQSPFQTQDDGSDVFMEFEMGNSSSEVHQQGNEYSSIPQHDAIDDEYDYLFQYPSVSAQDYTNIVVQTPAEHELRAPTPPAAVGTPRQTNNVSADDGDSNENNGGSNLDEEEEPTAQHLVLAQFVKVIRTKKTKKWKCTFKDGIMLLNNRDILFNEAMGEFDFYFCDSP
ncbi:Transcription initiation factor IIA subunit 1 [Rhynchospora pubera]|uniref:Transcription initiation factor IIA subunit 1 n=1 Tax=Rhynchospora pubera TaxID=906938 RepID=A0AAV8F885_9POAL|nr:Transcription initiation factor IIA subunit 1 [Rhynchospora pubera]